MSVLNPKSYKYCQTTPTITTEATDRHTLLSVFPFSLLSLKNMDSDQFQKNSMYVETPEAFGEGGKDFDDDGRVKRTGTHTSSYL